MLSFGSDSPFPGTDRSLWKCTSSRRPLVLLGSDSPFPGADRSLLEAHPFPEATRSSQKRQPFPGGPSFPLEAHPFPETDHPPSGRQPSLSPHQATLFSSLSDSQCPRSHPDADRAASSPALVFPSPDRAYLRITRPRISFSQQRPAWPYNLPHPCTHKKRTASDPSWS